MCRSRLRGLHPCTEFSQVPHHSVCLSVCLCLCLAASVPKMNCPPPQIPAKRQKVPRIVVLPQLDTARLFWKGIRCIAADRVYKLQKTARQKRKIGKGWAGCMQRSMAMANIGAEKINEFAELTCMRNNDTNTTIAGYVYIYIYVCSRK